MFESEITFDRFVRGLIVIMVVVLGIIAIHYLRSVLIPFFVAWFIAYLIFPIVHFFQHKCHLHSRILSILVTLTLFVGLVYGLVALAAPSVSHEMETFTKQIESAISKASSNNSIPTAINRFVRDYLGNVNINRLASQRELFDLAKETLPKVWNVIYQTADIIIGIIGSFIALLYMFFILCDYEKLSHGFMLIVPASKRPIASAIINDLNKGMNKYFRGQALISLCVGILFSIGFLIIGFPLAIPIGVLIGLLSLVPYLHALGIIPVLFFSIVKAASTGQNFWVILLSAMIVFAIVQIIQDTILTPRIMGKEMGLPPFLIFLSLSIWGYLLGIIGMIIALPLTNFIIACFKRYVNKEK